jgi:hypothetical protein
MRGTIDLPTVKARLAAEASEVAELALCYELPPDHDSFRDALHAQRALTEVLRQVMGSDAEGMPIFAVSDRDGERVEDYARAWGATMVRA